VTRRAWRTFRKWVWRTARDLAVNVVLNVFGFFIIFAGTGLLGKAVQVGMEKLLGWGLIWPALAFTLVAAAVWGTLFGLVNKEWIRNPAGKVLPLPALGLLLGGAAVWVYIFAAVSYLLARLGLVQYPGLEKPDDLLYKLPDAYFWHFFDLLPGLNVSTALAWKPPVDLQGGLRGVLLVLFRVAVIFQIFAKGRELLKRDEPVKT
jgi:hypothetical protein